MDSIAKLKKKYQINTESFDLAKKDFYKYCSTVNNPSFSVEKATEAFENLNLKFVDIFNIIANVAKIKESANIFRSEQKGIIPKVAFCTDTTMLDFTIGLFRDFYITTELKNPQNIKYMQDEFWVLLFELSTIGKFSFKEIEKPSKNIMDKHPQLFNKRGNYYKMLRNYFLYETEYNSIRSLGYIAVSWDSDTSFDILIPKFSQAFKIMYQLNLMLWKHDNKKVKL